MAQAVDRPNAKKTQASVNAYHSMGLNVIKISIPSEDTSPVVLMERTAADRQLEVNESMAEDFIESRSRPEPLVALTARGTVELYLYYGMIANRVRRLLPSRGPVSV
jgi:hypothetical protein